MTVWPAVHAERAALADDLASLTRDQWAHPSLCGSWTVEEVVAHLTAAASIGRLRWMRSVIGARFDFDVHNQRRLAEHRGADPDETLQRFRRVISSSTAASGHTPAWLGEVIVHGQDIRGPLGIEHTPAITAVTEVADFFASRDFTVSSKSAIQNLRLKATDGPFAVGDGPSVTGTTLCLVMAMAAPPSATTSTETEPQRCASAAPPDNPRSRSALLRGQGHARPLVLGQSPSETEEMSTHPNSTLSFADFLREVTHVREVMVTPAGRGVVHEAGVEPSCLLERIHLVERIGAAMTAQDLADPASLTFADRERVASGSDASVNEVDDLLARYLRIVGDAESS